MNDFSDLVLFGQAMGEVPLGGECSLNGVAYRKVVFNGIALALPCDVCPLHAYDSAGNRACNEVSRVTRRPDALEEYPCNRQLGKYDSGGIVRVAFIPVLVMKGALT